MPNIELINKYTKQIENLETQIIGIQNKFNRASNETLKNRHKENLDEKNNALKIAKQNLENAKQMDDNKIIKTRKKIYNSSDYNYQPTAKDLGVRTTKRLSSKKTGIQMSKKEFLNKLSTNISTLEIELNNIKENIVKNSQLLEKSPNVQNLINEKNRLENLVKPKEIELEKAKQKLKDAIDDKIELPIKSKSSGKGKKKSPYAGISFTKNDILEAKVLRKELKKCILIYKNILLTLPNSESNKIQLNVDDIIKIKVLSIKRNNIIVTLKINDRWLKVKRLVSLVFYFF